MRTLALAGLFLAVVRLEAQGPNPLNLWLVELRWEGDRLIASGPLKLTNDNGSNSQPSFTPDGRAIVFSALRDTGSAARSDIWRMDLATRTETRVTNTPENENSPTVNERGEYVAVRWVPATLFKEFGVWVFTPDGKPARGVLRGPDTTGYYTPLDNGNYALTRPKSKSFTLGLFDATTGVIVDVDSGIPALPVQRVPGEQALTYVVIDSLDGKHRLRRFDLVTRKTQDLGPTMVGRTAHAWVPGHNTVLMAKGNTLYVRKATDQGWQILTTFDHPDLRNASAYVVSPQGDKLILTSPKRGTVATILRDALERGISGRGAASAVLQMRDRGDLVGIDITEGSLGALGDDRIRMKRFDDGLAIHELATTLFPQSYRARTRLAEALEAAGNKAQAVESYRKALDLNPRATDADKRAAEEAQKKINSISP